MSQSLARILTHVVFSTKQRESFLTSAINPSLFAFMTGICRSHNSYVYQINGVEDHVHLLVSLSRTISLSNFLRELKGSSSKWLKEQDCSFRGFCWQAGYGAFSVSEQHREVVMQYITEQKEHHATIGFQEEFRHLLQRNNVEYDERYVWD